MNEPGQDRRPPRPLASLAWPEVPQRPVVLVPLGSTEQHGPHLPLGTDALIASAVTRRASAVLAEQLNRPVLAAPVLPYGASGEHEGFPGTISIGHEALAGVLVEIVRSLARWAGPVVLINAHGGNEPTLSDVVRKLRTEGHEVTGIGTGWASPCDSHAGRHETSLVAWLAHCGEAPSGAVRAESLVPGVVAPLADLLPRLRTGGVSAVSPTGVLGDPRGSSADEGERVLAACVEALVRAVRSALATPVIVGDP